MFCCALHRAREDSDRAMPETPAAPSPTSKRRERLAWIASIALAVLVVCTGCFMLFAFALTARGELTASLLGSEWRVWQLQQQGTSGIGVSQTGETAATADPPCRHTRVWLIMWQPSLKIEMTEYDECGASRGSPPVANVRRSVIIAAAGV